MSGPRSPLVAADLVIELRDRPGHPIVLIRRRNPPHGWALPGGFVEAGESVPAAACREALEETGLAVRLVALLGVYSEPGRDPRGPVVSIAYVARAAGEPRADDDAARVLVCAPDRPPSALAFDHEDILRDYRRWRRGEGAARLGVTTPAYRQSQSE